MLNVLWPFTILVILHRELIYQTLLVALMSVISDVSETEKKYFGLLCWYYGVALNSLKIPVIITTIKKKKCFLVATQ